jgi:hypothetical protein
MTFEQGLLIGFVAVQWALGLLAWKYMIKYLDEGGRND